LRGGLAADEVGFVSFEVQKYYVGASRHIEIHSLQKLSQIVCSNAGAAFAGEGRTPAQARGEGTRWDTLLSSRPA